MTDRVVYKNWAETFSCCPEKVFTPRTVYDIREIFRTARTLQKNVKVIGAGYSPSNIWCSEEYMISMKNFNRVIDVNTSTNEVTVESGILLSELLNELKQSDLTLSGYPVIDSVSLGGAISTGTHDTGADCGILASKVTALDILAADGTLMKCSRKDDEELFLAACCGLGALGVLIQITIKCEPMVRLCEETYPSTLDNVLANLDDIITGSQFPKLRWCPLTDQVQVLKVSPTTEPVFNPSSWFTEIFILHWIFEFLLWCSTFAPFMTRLIEKLMFHLVFSTKTKRVDIAPNIHLVDCLFKQHAIEWAIPRSQTVSVFNKLREWVLQSGYPAHFPVEVRFVKADDIYLSPAYERDSTFINILIYRPYGKDIDREDYWAAYIDIMKRHEGRPHWAKAHPLKRDDFEKLYPKWNKFCAIRKKMDPTDMFQNAYLKQVFDQ